MWDGREAGWRIPRCSTGKPDGVLPPESGLQQWALSRFADLPCYGAVLPCRTGGVRAALLAGGAGSHTPPVLQMPTVRMCSWWRPPALMKTTHQFQVLRISLGMRTKKFWWSGVCKLFLYFLAMADKTSFAWLNPVSISFTSVPLPPNHRSEAFVDQLLSWVTASVIKGAQAGQKRSYWETQGLGFFSQSQKLKITSHVSNNIQRGNPSSWPNPVSTEMNLGGLNFLWPAWAVLIYLHLTWYLP